MNGIALFIRSARSHLVPISFHVSHPVPSFFRSLRPQGSAYGTNGKEGGTGVSVENGGPERQTVSDGGRRDGKNTENPSRLSILLPWFYPHILSLSVTPCLAPSYVLHRAFGSRKGWERDMRM